MILCIARMGQAWVCLSTRYPQCVVPGLPSTWHARRYRRRLRRMVPEHLPFDFQCHSSDPEFPEYYNHQRVCRSNLTVRLSTWTHAHPHARSSLYTCVPMAVVRPYAYDGAALCHVTSIIYISAMSVMDGPMDDFTSFQLQRKVSIKKPTSVTLGR
jgi:hypothetical protein